MNRINWTPGIYWNVFILLFICLGPFYLIAPGIRYENFSSTIFDLGLYMNRLWNVSDLWRLAFDDHSQPLMFIWGAMYSRLPSEVAPFALLVSQSLFILTSVIAIARHYGPIPGVAMILYYPVAMNILFDYHFDHLAIPLLTIFFIFTDKNNYKVAFVAALGLLFVKETFALQTACCGLYHLYLFSKQKNPASQALLITGFLLVLFGIVVFILLTEYVIPNLSPSQYIAPHKFIFYGGRIENTNLVSWMTSEIFSLNNLIFLVAPAGFLLFIPLLRPAPLIVSLPVLLIAFASSNQNHVSVSSHYTAGLVVPFVVAFAKGFPILVDLIRSKLLVNRSPRVGLKSLRVKLSLLIVSLLAVCHFFTAFTPLGYRFWFGGNWSYSLEAYQRNERSGIVKAGLMKHIPRGEDFVIASQNSVNWHYLAHRQDFKAFPYGILSKDTHSGVRFIVIDLRRPWFYRDESCGWVAGICQDSRVEQEFLNALGVAKDYYRIVFEFDGFYILQRN